MIEKSDKKLVVADTSPLIALAIMELFPVLDKLFETVYAPPAVVRECLHDLTKEKSQVIQKAITEQMIQEKRLRDSENCRMLSQILDAGEAEAISLAKELGAMVLIDEKAGRKVARRESVVCIGSLSVLIKAKQMGLVTSAQVLIERLLQHGYYLDKNLIEQVLAACNE